MNEQSFVQTVGIEPVRKQLKVSLSAQQAFELFTDGIGKWWPLLTHSVGEEQAETCFLEGWVGGRIVEVLKDGSQAEWGRVLIWDPPHRVSFTWHPGRGPETAQDVTVTFSEAPDGTQVELVHIGWETLGALGQARRDGYVQGWDLVLGKYVEAAGS